MKLSEEIRSSNGPKNVRKFSNSWNITWQLPQYSWNLSKENFVPLHRGILNVCESFSSKKNAASKNQFYVIKNLTEKSDTH